MSSLQLQLTRPFRGKKQSTSWLKIQFGMQIRFWLYGLLCVCHSLAFMFACEVKAACLRCDLWMTAIYCSLDIGYVSRSHCKYGYHDAIFAPAGYPLLWALQSCHDRLGTHASAEWFEAQDFAPFFAAKATPGGCIHDLSSASWSLCQAHSLQADAASDPRKSAKKYLQHRGEYDNLAWLQIVAL